MFGKTSPQGHLTYDHVAFLANEQVLDMEHSVSTHGFHERLVNVMKLTS